MGVLKKLTDEYFEKTLRTERGKYLDVKGCRVIVPQDYDEEMFLENIQELLKKIPCGFVTKKTMVPGYTFCLSKNNCIFQICPYENFVDDIIDETMFESFIKFMKYVIKDIDISIEKSAFGYNYCILFVNHDDYLNFLPEEIEDEENDDDNFNKYVYPIQIEFFDEFEEKARIMRSEMIYYSDGENNESIIAMDTENTDHVIQLKTLLYANEMKQWWADKIDEVLETGGIEKYIETKSEK